MATVVYVWQINLRFVYWTSASFHLYSCLHFRVTNWDRGSTVVKVLRYKSEGRWFDPRWFHGIFHWHKCMSQLLSSRYLSPSLDRMWPWPRAVGLDENENSCNIIHGQKNGFRTIGSCAPKLLYGPPQRRRAILWMLANFAVFRTNITSPKTNADYLIYLQSAFQALYTQTHIKWSLAFF
jgi:hypothetical protein